MKKSLLAWAPAILILLAALWHGHRLRQEHAVLAARKSALHTMAKDAPVSAEASSANEKSPGRNQVSAALAATLQQIHAEEAALAAAKRQADDLASRLPSVAADELITSFGRVEDMGREAGEGLQGLIRVLMGAPPDDDQSQKDIFKLLRVKGRVPEIRNFEDNPDEIARFQSSTLKQALHLGDSAEAAMRPLIRDAFAEMAAQKLTAAQMPETAAEKEAWITLRSDALRQLMLKLRPHLPNTGSVGTQAALMFALNVGAGFEEKQSITSGLSTMSLGVTWPSVPW